MVERPHSQSKPLRFTLKNNYMFLYLNILTLSQSLTKEQFTEALYCFEQINDAGLMVEFVDLVVELMEQGSSLDSAIHHANYDLLIDSETGKYKKEIEAFMPSSGKN
jgi:hypothetical protein